MTRLEQETIINFNEAKATANVYTHNAALCRKLEALADQRPEEVKRGRSFPDGGREYTIPKRWVKRERGADFDGGRTRAQTRTRESNQKGPTCPKWRVNSPAHKNERARGGYFHTLSLKPRKTRV